MSHEDPWGAAPAPAETTAPAEPKQAPVTGPNTTAASAAVDSVSVQHSTDGVSATFKFDGAYSSPWVVVKGSDPSDVLAKVNTLEFKALMDKVKDIAGRYAGAATPPANSGSGGGGGQSAPAGASQAPNGETRNCSHGAMVFKSGVSKAGNAYKLFSCTAPRDQQCKAQYLRD